MKRFALALLVLLPVTASAGHLHPESFYIAKWCADHGGQTEVRMPDGSRADCITAEWAVEVGFAESPWENTPQAINYAKWTGKRALVVIVVENAKAALPFLQRTLNTASPTVTYELWEVGE